MGDSSDGNCVNIFIIKTEVNTLLYFLTDPHCEISFTPWTCYAL